MKYIFYELSSNHDPQFWSPNTGKIRTLLNYLGIKYELQYIKYPDIASELRKKGVISWKEQGRPDMYTDYTLPALTIDTKETVMGDFNIIEILTIHEQDVHDKIFQGEEQFAHWFEKYRTEKLVPLVFHIVGPFIYNAMNDDRCKRYYQDSTKQRNSKDDMLFLQNQTRDQLLSQWHNFQDEMLSFNVFYQMAIDNGWPVETIKTKIDQFLTKKTKFLITNSSPTYADFVLFANFKWLEIGILNGCVEFDFLGDIYKDWYQRMEAYNY